MLKTFLKNIQIFLINSFKKCKLRYDVIDEQGPAHSKVFKVKCCIVDAKNQEVESYTATGASKNQAKAASAEMALAQSKLPKNPNSFVRRPQSECFLFYFL
jgi:dsRNA-specific ribonuclease